MLSCGELGYLAHLWGKRRKARTAGPGRPAARSGRVRARGGVWQDAAFFQP